MAVQHAPALLVDAAREALDALEQTITAATFELEQRHADVFADFRSRLEALFLRHSILPKPEPAEPGDAPKAIVPRWNPLTARRGGMLDAVKQLFAELMVQLGQADTEQFSSAFDDMAEQGFDRSLWQMALAGLDTGPYVEAEPEDWSERLLDDTLNGQNWQDRLGVWGDVTTDKVSRWVGSSILGGLSLSDTLDGFSRMAVGHTQRIAGLFDNEAFRAFSLAGLVAMTLVANDHPLDTLWVARTMPGGQLDLKVCPICAAKHLTVTRDRPVDDSHPGCRCIKVQVPEDFVPTPQSFESFQARNSE